jgi:hypothetical protein
VIVTDAPLDEQAPLFTERERAELDPYRYQLTPGKSLSVVDLATAWAAHVRKIGADRTRPPDDPRTWGPYDLVAALHIRDFLARCADTLPVELKDKVSAAVVPSDQLFREMTQPDDSQLVARIEQQSVAGKPWWWHRVPDSGPLLDELRALS